MLRPELAQDLEIVVVVDRAGGAATEVIAEFARDLPLRSCEGPEMGRSAARNAAFAAATGDIVWFLDDDVVPLRGALARHRRTDAPSDDVVVGPIATLASDRSTVGRARSRIARAITEQQMSSPVLSDAWLFRVANTSMPARTFADVGGFDESFQSYGYEDIELGRRLLMAGARITSDSAAGGTEISILKLRDACERARESGVNAARLVDIEPAWRDRLLPHTRWAPVINLIARALPTRVLPIANRLLRAGSLVESWVTRSHSSFVFRAAIVMHFAEGAASSSTRGDDLFRSLVVGK
jgi:glycosyltransferase involved in cell wall biosynthesis